MASVCRKPRQILDHIVSKARARPAGCVPFLYNVDVRDTVDLRNALRKDIHEVQRLLDSRDVEMNEFYKHSTPSERDRHFVRENPHVLISRYSGVSLRYADSKAIGEHKSRLENRKVMLRYHRAFVESNRNVCR